MSAATTASGEIVGQVDYRVGDGPKLSIPRGPVQIETTSTEVTLSWEHDDVRGVATLTLAEFRHFVDDGSIRLDR